MELKKTLRNKLLQQRKDFDEFKYMRENESIIQNTKNLIDSFSNKFKKNISIKSIPVNFDIDLPNKFSEFYYLGLYWTLKGEPDLFKLVINTSWNIALPKINNSSMKYVKYQIGTPLEKGKFEDLMQPVNNIEIIPKIVIVPGLAFSVNGFRLGFGLGCYDIYLSNISKLNSIIKIGVCFHDNLFEYLPTENHDIKFDYIITDKITIKL